MTSSNGNIFRVTGHLCGEFTGHRWVPRTKASDSELWCFLWSCWVNHGEAGDLRRHLVHYDVTVMITEPWYVIYNALIFLTRGVSLLKYFFLNIKRLHIWESERIVLTSNLKYPHGDNLVLIGCVVHYNDAVMTMMASQITSLTIVYSSVCSDADQRKHQSSASLAFVWGIHRGPVNSPHKWPVTHKIFPFDDVMIHFFFKYEKNAYLRIGENHPYI